MAAWFYVTSAIDPFPKIHIPHTYPENGQHLHPMHHLSSIPYAAHNLYNKFHDNDLSAHQPRTDVRETIKNFYLEVELPGVKEHTDLRLRWTNSRTLLLSSRIGRPEIPEEGGEEEKKKEEEKVVDEPGVAAPSPAPETALPNGAATTAPPPAEPTPLASQVQVESIPKLPPTPPQKTKHLPPHLTIHERPIGEQLRGFSFPVDVDRDTTHAKLDAGVLNIVVPKVMHAAPAEGEEKHFLHIPVKVFSHGHEHGKTEEEKEGEKKKSVEDPVPANRRGYIEALGDRLY